jgi:nucleoid-associated protein YgaU
VVALVAFIAVFSMLNSVVSADGADAMHTEVPRTVIAQPGDTIWAIARRVMPHGNINSLVDQLVKLNGATISVGQSIRIP